MSTATRPNDEYLGLVMAGYVLAFVLPICGFIAAGLLDKRRPGHSLAIAFISLPMLLFYGWVFFAGAT